MVAFSAMKICVIGTGYVGLVAGAGFADMGNDVVCCDIDQPKIDGLKRGEMPIYEPGLDKLVVNNVAEGRLSFTTNVADGVAGAEVVLLAVGTPPGPDDKRSIETLRSLYAPFTRTSDRMLVMERRSAELTKYAANSMLATRISFMNDLANLCELLGADI